MIKKLILLAVTVIAAVGASCQQTQTAPAPTAPYTVTPAK